MTIETTTAPSVSLPRSWHRRRDPGPGVVVAVRAASLPSSGVLPDVVLSVVEVDSGHGLESWRTAALADLGAVLVDLAVEDDDVYDLEGRDVHYHRFAHRVGAADVLCDQWSWLSDGHGVVLTCSAAREDYPDLCDLFEAVAGTVTLG